MMSTQWPEHLPVVQVRVARPTNRLKEVVRFYKDGLGLEVIGHFERQYGYDGVTLGLPGREYHLQFTQYKHGSPCPAPSHGNLLVLYMPDKAALDSIVARLGVMGHYPVSPDETSQISGITGLTFKDPEGWRVVLQNTSGI